MASISEAILSNIMEEALKLQAAMETGIIRALEKSNITVIRYSYNRIQRIKRCLDKNRVEKVIKNVEEAIEEAMIKFMLFS